MTVLNYKDSGLPAGAIFIGRPSKWGNPYVVGRHGTRDEVIELYRRRLWKLVKARFVTIGELAELHGKDLVCYCAPKACHGQVLEHAAAWAHAQLTQRNS